MKPIVFTATATLALSSLAGCSSLAGSTQAPDEFKVVTKAPLTVPPEYNLRPPGQGVVRPPELDPSAQGISFAFGTTIGTNASDVEKRFVAEAKATATNPMIRAQIDYDEAKLLRKKTEFADQILSSADTTTTEASDSATGGGDVVISTIGNRVKLPGT